jgi:hypothetical protein
MRVVVTRTPPGEVDVRLADADDFDHFSVEIAAPVPVVAGETIGGIVRIESTSQGWVDQTWLREAGRFGSGERLTAFESMLLVAKRHGWLDATSGEIAAHLSALE